MLNKKSKIKKKNRRMRSKRLENDVMSELDNVQTLNASEKIELSQKIAQTIHCNYSMTDVNQNIIKNEVAKAV